MTISDVEARRQYTAAAGQTRFNIPFLFERNSDLLVYKTLAGEDPDPVTDILVLDTDYTVYGEGWGTTLAPRYFDLTDAASVGDIITVIRDMPLARETDFAISGEFSAADLNDQFDDVVAMIQQVNTKLTQLGLLYVNNQLVDQSSLKLQNTLPLLPAPSDGMFPVWTTNSVGTLIAGELEENPDCSGLRAELLNDQSGTDGARIVGYENILATPENTTVHAALDELFTALPSASFTTGDVKPTYKTTADATWIMMNDEEIGSATSSAPTYHGPEYEALFKLLWASTSNDDCPVLPSGRGTSADDDWTNNKTIRLPQVKGRALAGSGQAALTSTFTTDYAAPGAATHLTLASTARFTNGMKVQFTNSGGSLPAGLNTATDYYVTVLNSTTLEVSTSTTNYTDGTFVTLTSDGTGIHTIEVQFTDFGVGEDIGYENHIQTLDELVEHNHTYTAHEGPGSGTPGLGDGAKASGNVSTNKTGTSTAFSVMAPTSFCNFMIKL